MNDKKMVAGSIFPTMTWAAVDGGKVDIQAQMGWRLLVIYRGKHCPLCKSYLDQLEQMKGQFNHANIYFAAVSSDPKEKAKAEAAECSWTFPIGYDLSIPQMRELGLYISDPRSPEETDRPFSEPAIFVINPQGLVQIIDISNAPFSRPDLSSLLKGLQFVISKDYPIRGRA